MAGSMKNAVQDLPGGFSSFVLEPDPAITSFLDAITVPGVSKAIPHLGLFSHRYKSLLSKCFGCDCSGRRESLYFGVFLLSELFAGRCRGWDTEARVYTIHLYRTTFVIRHSEQHILLQSPRTYWFTSQSLRLPK